MYSILEKDGFIYIYSKAINLSNLDSLKELEKCFIIIKKMPSKIPLPTNNKDFIKRIHNLEEISINNFINKHINILKLKELKKSCCDSINNNPNFISSLSHQIKTPLNGIISGLQIINSNIIASKEKSIIKLLLKSSLDLTTYINDIIDYYLLEQDKIKLNPVETNLKDFIKNIEKHYNLEAKRKNIVFSYDILSKCPETIYIDKTRLLQILNNIINNSIKFSQNEMIILEIDTTNDNKRIIIKINDTGSGINPTQLDLVWNPFYQIKENWLTNQEGIGLGLTISKYLVELMGGTIIINSSVDSITKGTNVIINIPINIYTDKNIQTNQEKKNKFTKIINHNYHKFLIIDDNIINSTLLKLMILKMLTINSNNNKSSINPPIFKILNDSKEGLKEILKQENYDYIFLDIKMPIISGYDILKHLHSSYPNKINNIIIISALITHDIREKTNMYPIKGVLPKPIQMSELEKILSS